MASIHTLHQIALLSLMLAFCAAAEPAIARSADPPTLAQRIALAEKRIGFALDDVGKRLRAQQISEDSLHTVLAGAAEKSVNRKLQKELKKLLAERKFLYTKRNMLREMLTDARQFPYQPDSKVLRKLRSMENSLDLMDSGKLPVFDEQKQLSAEEGVRGNTAVYAQDIGAPCRVEHAADGKRKATAYSEWFSHTAPELEKHVRGQDFMRCEARFLESRKDTYLELRIVFNSYKASDFVGSIDPSLPARIDFLNESFIYLTPYAVAEAVRDRRSGQTVFHVQFQLDREDMRYLSRQQADVFTLFWTSGPARYEIVRLDVLGDLLTCLREAE
ncbi:MAG: hypothetical protein IT266_07360 [Saprospiraceae bacterium]|nr:hypothetical protein [Saprospiraceae bacterium]